MDMKILEQKLWNVSDSYIDFVHGMMSYSMHSPQRPARLEKFIDEHPDATTSDIIYYVSCLPDFYDDAVGRRMTEPPHYTGNAPYPAVSTPLTT